PAHAACATARVPYLARVARRADHRPPQPLPARRSSDPGGAFAKVATDSTPGASGSFAYTASVDGSYDFYTRATDKAGNLEAAPAGPESTTLADTRARTSNAISPFNSTPTTFTLGYTASD